MKLRLKKTYILFDRKDFKIIDRYVWHLHSAGYAATNDKYYYRSTKKRRMIYMHRLIMDAPKDKCVDHINGNRLDNRKCNLRLCAKSENLDNSRKYGKTTSAYMGVYWDKNRLKWHANISIKNRHIHIGSFDKEIDAAKARDVYAKRFRGEFANLNFRSKK